MNLLRGLACFKWLRRPPPLPAPGHRVSPADRRPPADSTAVGSGCGSPIEPTTV